MADIVIAEFMDEAVVAEAFAGRDVLYDPELVDRPRDLEAALTDARALIVRNRTQVRGPLLASARSLIVVGRLGVGLDNIDIDACRAREIAVEPATGANDSAVAEYVIAAAMMLVRRAFLASEAVASGAWPRRSLIGREIAGLTLGLVGFGAIARKTAGRAAALGMRVAACDPYLPADDPAWAVVKRMERPDLLSTADVLSLHVPLTSETRHLIGAGELAAMKPGAMLINASRGGVVDEDALAAALRAGDLGAAALDVFEEEPLTAAAGRRFEGLSNIVLTPHIAGVTEQSNVRVSQVTARNVLAHLE